MSTALSTGAGPLGRASWLAAAERDANLFETHLLVSFGPINGLLAQAGSLGSLAGPPMLALWVEWTDWSLAPVVHALQALRGMALVVAFVQYSLQVAESPQGRYLYLMLLPAALLFTGGLYALPPRRIPKVIALSIPILWLGAMNAVGLGLVK